MSDTPLAGRVAVVSGGGRGLGRSFCRALARQGAKVVVNNRNRVTDADGRGPADHVAAEIVRRRRGGGRALRRGRLDIGVANAAIGPGGMFHKQPAAQFGEVLEINLQGSVRLARAAMAVMRPAGYGRIILVGSTGGLVAPVLTALASPECRLNGEYLVTGGGRLRRASVVEWGTVLLPNGPGLSPGQLHALLAESGRGEPREYRVTVDAFNDLMSGGAS